MRGITPETAVDLAYVALVVIAAMSVLPVVMGR